MNLLILFLNYQSPKVELSFCGSTEALTMDTFDCEEGRRQGNSPFTSSAELPLGINLRRFPHLLVTCSTLYRWIRLISNCKDYFELRPIHVKRVARMFLEFVEKPSKLPALKEDSLESPPPGLLEITLLFVPVISFSSASASILPDAILTDEPVIDSYYRGSQMICEYQ